MRLFSRLPFSVGLTVLGVGWIASQEPHRIQGFVEFCAYKGANLTDGHWLGAYCRNNMTEVFGYNYTWLDLDLCVGNNGSQLIAYDRGNYSTSCTGCNIYPEKKTLMLNCSCEGADSNYWVSSLDLNTTIYDDNGSAGCFGHLGNKTQHGP